MEEEMYLAGKSFKTSGLLNIKPGGVESLTHIVTTYIYQRTRKTFANREATYV